MIRKHLWRVTLLAGLLVPAWSWGAEPPPQGGAPENKSPASRGVDAMNFPAGSIVVICEELKTALNLIPKAVVLTPEKYQELLDQIERLKRQLKADKPLAPGVCKLQGKLEQDRILVQAKFEFNTDRPRAVVALGCQKAWLKSAAMDGKLPFFLPDEENLLLQVEKPGVHQVTLELELPVVAKTGKASEQGFDFSLPRAAITNVEELVFPETIKEVRINNRLVKTMPAAPAPKRRIVDVPLGAADRLDLAWSAVAGVPKGPPLLEAKGKMAVRVDESWITTDADLTLRVLRGETKQWRIQVAPDALPEIKEPFQLDPRIEGIDRPNAQNPVLVIRLKAASAEPLRVVLQVRQPRSNVPIPIGPFSVFDAFRQYGTITLSAATGLRLQYQLQSNIAQEEAEEQGGESTTAAFSYWNLPAPAPSKPGERAGPVPAPLTVRAESVKGAVETKIDHRMRWTDQGWQITSTLAVKPIHAGVERLELEVPANYQYDEASGVAPAELIENPVELKESNPQHRLMVFKLFQKQFRPFTLTFRGVYPMAGDIQRASLEFPRPLQTLDRGGQVVASLPEGWELVQRDSQASGPRERTWSWERAPVRLDLAWRPFKPELAVATEVNVTLSKRQALVRQRMHFSWPTNPPGRIDLLLPPAPAKGFDVLVGGKLDADGGVNLPRQAGKEHTLELEFAFPAAEQPRTNQPLALPVPLVWAKQATRTNTKVRFWSQPGTQPALVADGPWIEHSIEAVPERDALPALVVRSNSAEAPLVVALAQTDTTPLPGVVIDRALVRVLVDQEGQAAYRARFLISQLNARSLDVEFPSLLAGPDLLLLGDKKLDQWEFLPRKAEENITRLRFEVEPDLFQKPVVLVMRYKVAPEVAASRVAGFRRLSPPVIAGSVLLNRVRWQVELPGGWLPVFEGAGFRSEQQWSWRGGLLTPVPSATAADLERWLLEGGQEEKKRPEDGEPTWIGSRTSFESVTMVIVPQQLWLLICSLVFLALGIVSCFLPLPRGVLLLALFLVAATLATTAIGWPSFFASFLYGCEPGALILVLLLGFQWMLRQRYRRRLIFMPGFTRLKAGSSVLPAGSSHKRPKEPSTVDAPPATGSGSQVQVPEAGK